MSCDSLDRVAETPHAVWLATGWIYAGAMAGLVWCFAVL
jgi:hypothetical protein